MTELFEEGVKNFSFRHRVPYRELSKGVYKPIVTVTFKDKMGEDLCSLAMLVDTGADNIVLPQDWCAFFDVEPEDCQIVKGHTARNGTVVGYQMKDAILCLDDINQEKVFSNKICFVAELNDTGFGLLGRDVLEEIRVCFAHKPEMAFYLDFNS